MLNRTARRLGRRIPEDLAVVGYNDVELARYLGLSTVHIPMREMGRRGADLLLERLADPAAPRCGCACPPGWSFATRAVPPAPSPDVVGEKGRGKR